MRPIHVVHLDKRRPAVVLTREVARPRLRYVTVAPITSTIRGISTEVLVGPANQLDHESAVALDNITTIPVDDLGTQIGWLLPHQEPALAAAIQAAFDLDGIL